MKILIIASARTGSTFLTHFLKKQHTKSVCLFEYYTYNKNHSIHENTKKINLNYDSYILKLMGHNINNLEVDIKNLNLEKYDKIYTVARHDFFRQCCSLQFSLSTKIWHYYKNKDYDSLKEFKCDLNIDTINFILNDVYNYAIIIQYLKNNNLKFTHYWNSDLQHLIYNYHEISISDPKLNYQYHISNYNKIKNYVLDQFQKKFKYLDNIYII